MAGRIGHAEASRGVVTRLPDIGCANLWLIDLDAPLDDDASCLSAAETQRAARFVFERDRHRYVQAHAALRRILATALSVKKARDLVYAEGSAGKPSLSGHPSCRFNLSHSGPLGLVAIDRHCDIGVDIEVLRPVGDRIALAQQHFDASELATIGSAQDDATAFLCCWTRKEACLKAVGTGLDRDLRLVSTGCSTEARTVQLTIGPTARSVRVESFIQPGAFVASLARVVERRPTAAV